jgi:riboflavin kinase / FMN adenylyltransferase
VITHTSFETFKQVPNPIVTIGTFDGVHLGHTTILQKLKSLASEASGESALLTFYPHPRMVLYPDDHGLQLLNSPEEKARLLEAAGLDHLMILPFTREFARMPAYDYVRDLLVHGMHIHTLVIGYDHRFGRNREGNHETLMDLSETFGYNVYEIPAQQIDTAEISSTKIRAAIGQGDVEHANKLLGYPYTLEGRVVHGDGRGKTIGFPTANIQPYFELKQIPAHGVYAAWLETDHATLRAVVNIGLRPTFEGSNETHIEAHAIDYDGDLYNKSVRLRFISRLRSEQKFGSIVELTNQINADIQNAHIHFQ